MARLITELIDVTDPAWPLVQGWVQDATNHVEVLRTTRADGEATLTGVQVTTRSPMGAIALECGRILIDHGWLRILGADNARMRQGLLEWNGLGDTTSPDPRLRDAMVVAHDAIGGFFAINGGAFGDNELGHVFYFAPDSLRWEDLGMGYAAFLQWALTGDLASFYESSRWPSWEVEIAGVTGDDGFSIYPFLSAGGAPVDERSRRVVPMTELWTLHWHLANQVGGLPDGAAFVVRVDD